MHACMQARSAGVLEGRPLVLSKVGSMLCSEEILRCSLNRVLIHCATIVSNIQNLYPYLGLGTYSGLRVAGLEPPTTVE